MNELILVSKVVLLAYTLSRFEPLRWLLDLLPDRLLYNIVNLLLTCSKCIAFWSGLVMTQDIWLAMLASLTTTLLEKTLFNWIEKVRLN